MIYFKPKNFSKGSGLKYLKDHPTLPISAAALGISVANLGTNSKRQREAREIADRQTELMNKQINTMSANTKAIKDFINSNREVSNTFREGFQYQQKQEPNKKKKKRFLLFSSPESKQFSVKSSTIAGAQLGFAIGGLGSVPSFLPKELKGKNTLSENYNKITTFQKQAALTAAGTIIGAALGALVGVIGEIDKKGSRGSVKDRLLPDVISNLKKDHFKEGIDFTRDPKTADRLKTRVCIALSKNSGDLRILINTESDPKLKNITSKLVRNIPNSGVDNRTASNKYNEITISTISDSSSDATLVSGIISQFIHNGFPVYIVEVG